MGGVLHTEGLHGQMTMQRLSFWGQLGPRMQNGRRWLLQCASSQRCFGQAGDNTAGLLHAFPKPENDGPNATLGNDRLNARRIGTKTYGIQDSHGTGIKGSPLAPSVARCRGARAPSRTRALTQACFAKLFGQPFASQSCKPWTWQPDSGQLGSDAHHPKAKQP